MAAIKGMDFGSGFLYNEEILWQECGIKSLVNVGEYKCGY